MVARLKSGSRKVSSFVKVMQPESIIRLASYIYIDKALISALVKTGLTDFNVDEIRTLLIMSQNPGFDISSPLEYYDALVMELANFLVQENSDLIQEEIAKVQAVTLGLEEPEMEEQEVETVVELPSTDVEPPSAIYYPEKLRIVKKSTGQVIYRSKPVKWRERKQQEFSSQEQFVYSRAGEPIEDVQRDYINRFKIYRSKQAILVKQRRLIKKSPEGEGERMESLGLG